MVDVLKIYSRVVNRLRHITEVAIKHGKAQARTLVAVAEVLVNELALGDLLQVLAVLGLAVAIGAGE